MTEVVLQYPQKKVVDEKTGVDYKINFSNKDQTSCLNIAHESRLFNEEAFQPISALAHRSLRELDNEGELDLNNVPIEYVDSPITNGMGKFTD
jgi:hypothetical protein